MTKTILHCLAALATAALLLGHPVIAAPLTTVASLQQDLARGAVVLIDTNSAKAYAAGHIPGALNVDIFGFGGLEPSPAEMEKRIQSWGIGPGTKVVLYDAGATYLATSLFFDLLYFGVPAENLAVLDGGLAKWQAAGGTVTREPTPAPAPGAFRIGALREDVRVRLPEFLFGSGDPARHALVEALDPPQHFGAMKFFDRAGHVPHAIMAPAVDFFNADKTFKSPAEIRKMLAYLGVRPDQKVYAHCGGGIAATVPFFAAKYMAGYPDVKVYKESQLEWLRDDRGLPFWTYDAPNQLREKTWLSGWNNAMLRMFNASKLAVIDVRPRDAFQQAHLPFAINVPGDVFRQHRGSPEKLAAALGAAGVDVNHEAVIVSQGGLTPDAALAYLALERLGQKRVSVLADSVDDWGFAGFPLNKGTDAADPKKPAPAAAKPTKYPVAATAPRISQGLYPKVYVASGKAMPTKMPEGKVVHVPYTELLDATGKPKAAKDLWTILTKAGVPRYAELVSVADDAGEAAVGYFVLKLMGYPDVKVP